MRHNLLFIGVAAAVVSAIAPAWAQDGVVTGTGSAVVSRDTEVTRAQAEAAARADVVRGMARQVLGAERLGELSPDMVNRLANQIRSEMIVDRSSERVGREFRVSLSARIDRAWFQQRLDDEGVLSSADIAGGARQRMLVILDEAIGAPRDLSQPVEVTREYDRSQGSSFNDQSSLAYADRAAAASTSSYEAGRRSSGSGGAAYQNGYGAGGARYSGSSASGVREREASAATRSTTLNVQNDVQAETWDEQRYREHIVYRPTGSSQIGTSAMNAMSSNLLRYDVQTASAVNTLSGYAPGPTPLYDDLLSSGRWNGFLSYADSRASAPFVLVGKIRIIDAGRDAATGQAACSGELSVEAYASGDSRHVGTSTRSLNATDRTYEGCSSLLAQDLSRLAVEEIGPIVQRDWRSRSRAQAATVARAAGPVDYTLTVRGDLPLAAQADFMDALVGTPGVVSHVFLEQSQGQISLKVRYEGAQPLQMAIYQRLRGEPAFAGMDSRVDGQAVLLCVSGGC